MYGDDVMRNHVVSHKEEGRLFNAVTFDRREFLVYLADLQIDRLFSFSLIPKSIRSTRRSWLSRLLSRYTTWQSSQLGQISNGHSEAISASTKQGRSLIYYLLELEDDPVTQSWGPAICMLYVLVGAAIVDTQLELLHFDCKLNAPIEMYM